MNAWYIFGGRVGDVVCYDFAQNTALGVCGLGFRYLDQNLLIGGDDDNTQSLWSLINELQQTRVPCHQTNRIKTKANTGLFVLAASCS